MPLGLSIGKFVKAFDFSINDFVGRPARTESTPHLQLIRGAHSLARWNLVAGLGLRALIHSANGHSRSRPVSCVEPGRQGQFLPFVWFLDVVT